MLTIYNFLGNLEGNYVDYSSFPELPEEGKVKGFIEWRRLINEEKLVEMT